ncbi:MAG: HIT domain-containing protein [Acidobacteriota bacterium]|nr:HIT domain-containing protein [Acidobacteriota bacterium]
MDYLWSPWRYRYLLDPDKSGECVFCQIAAAYRDEETLIVHRGRYNFIVLNKFPYTSGHLMVVPFAHASELSAVEEAASTEMMNLARLAERHLRSLYRPDGLNIGMNIGASAGAGIAGHIHMHVLPRWNGDANFMTTIGETRVLPEELSDTWRRLSEAFAS